MARRSARVYNSPQRQQQAGETRQRILDAARKLILSKGQEKTTIEAIASEAAVAPPTVYATFGSKRGIVEALMQRAAFGQGYRGLVQEALESDDPEKRLRFAARIATQIYEATRSEMKLLQGANTLAPALMRQKENVRLERQASLIDLIVRKGALRAGITKDEARDILWALTGRDQFRLLVMEQKWSTKRYEQWLGDTLVAALLAPKKS